MGNSTAIVGYTVVSCRGKSNGPRTMTVALDMVRARLEKREPLNFSTVETTFSKEEEEEDDGDNLSDRSLSDYHPEDDLIPAHDSEDSEEGDDRCETDLEQSTPPNKKRGEENAHPVLSKLAPYVVLAEKLVRLNVHLVAGGSGVKSVKVTYASARAPDDQDTRLLRFMIIRGVIEPISNVFMNLVNVDFIAKHRGLRIGDERILFDGSPKNPLEYIQVQIANEESKFANAVSDSGEIKVEGMVKNEIPHFTKVGSFECDVSMEGSLMLCRQVEQPGMIGTVGSILGDSNSNVSFMSLGRIAPRKHVVMAIGLDDEPNNEALKKIGDIPVIEEFVYLKL